MLSHLGRPQAGRAGPAPSSTLWAGSQQQVAQPLSRNPTTTPRPPLTLWGQKPQGRGLWGLHRTQRSAGLGRQGQEKRAPLSPRDQPLTPATLQSHKKPSHLPSPVPHPWCEMRASRWGLLGPQSWPTTVISLPLFPTPFLEGFSRNSPPPFPQTLTWRLPPPPLFLSSPHLFRSFKSFWGPNHVH